MNEIVGTLMEVGCVVITGAVIYAIGMGAAALKQVIAKQKTLAEQENKKAMVYGLEVADKMVSIVSSGVVGKLEQKTAKDLRELVKDGKADKEQLEALAKQAYEEIMQQIKPEVIAELNRSMTDVESYIKNEIEKQLYLIKKKDEGIAWME